MAGLFIVSLPTASYEIANRSGATDANKEDPNSVVIDIENVEKPSNDKQNYVTPSSSTEDIGPNSKNGIKNFSKTLNKTDSKSLQNTNHSKNLLFGHSVSSPAIPSIGQSFDFHLESNNIKMPNSPQSVSNSESNSTEILISDLPVTANKVGKESEISLVNIGRKLVTAFTQRKGPPTPDSVSTTSKPDATAPLETIMLYILEKLGVDAVWNAGKSGNFYQVFFSVDSADHCEECLDYLNEYGFGFRHNTTVSVIPCSLFYKGEEQEESKDVQETKKPEMHQEQKVPEGYSSNNIPEGDGNKVWDWNKFVSSVRARLIVAQVVESVRANAELTFDFIMLLLVAGLVAAMGLVENSSVVLVASMLISPLMGPILAGTFGTVIQDRQLQKIGVFNELLGLALCILVGFLFGLVVGCSSDHYSYSSAAEWPTNEMVSRGVIRSLWVGTLIALPSGAGVALSVLGGNAGSLVGVAISASLLPPAVNAGLLWALAVIEALSTPEEKKLEKLFFYSENDAIEYASLGAVSLCLTLVNIACIFVAAVLMLKIKEVAPQTSRDDIKRFWKHDIKIARDYNRTMQGEDANKLSKQLWEELAVIPPEQMEALVEEAALGMRNRFDIRKRVSESGMYEKKESAENLNVNNNQRTWTPGINTLYSRPRFGADFRRKSVSVPSDQDVENLVYSTLTTGSKHGLFKNVGRSSVTGYPPYRKISSSNFVGNQVRSPPRSGPMEPQLDTIRESTASLMHLPNAATSPQNKGSTKRFHVTLLEENSEHGNTPHKAKAPLAKSEK